MRTETGERNPYAPPGAAVGYDEAGPRRTRPLAIRRALFLMWASLGLEPVSLAIDWPHAMSLAQLKYLILFSVFWIGLLAWFIVKIGAARNWARICYLVACIVGYGLSMPGITEEAARAPLVAGIDLIMLGMDVGALYLMFVPGREWFWPQPSAAKT